MTSINILLEQRFVEVHVFPLPLTFGTLSARIKASLHCNKLRVLHVSWISWVFSDDFVCSLTWKWNSSCSIQHQTGLLKFPDQKLKLSLIWYISLTKNWTEFGDYFSKFLIITIMMLWTFASRFILTNWYFHVFLIISSHLD